MRNRTEIKKRRPIFDHWWLWLALFATEAFASLEETGADSSFSFEHLGVESDTPKRVVFIPVPTTSNAIMHSHVAETLAARYGHEVWLVLPTSMARGPFLSPAGRSNFSLLLLDDAGREFEPRIFPKCVEAYFAGRDARNVEVLKGLQDVGAWILGNASFWRQIELIKPDLIVFTSAAKALAALPYELGVPFALIGPQLTMLSAHIPFSPAAEPFPFLQLTDHMTFLERVKNTVVYYIFFMLSTLRNQNAASVYAPHMPLIADDALLARAEIWLVETDHIVDFPRPTLPNVKFVGGISAGPAKPLPPRFRSFMDNATEGVLVASFGSIILEVPPHISAKLFKVFMQLPMKVVFRSNLASPDPSKILTATWIPQNDLLGHSNTRAFLSHCGNGGQYESVYHAVPLLCTPMTSDQPYNSNRVRAKGFGEAVDLKTVSVEEMVAVLSKLVTQPSYKLAVSKASRLFRRLYGSPSEEAAMWLDHVMQYGGQYMRFSGQNLPLFQFLMLDVWLFVFFLIVVTCGTCLGCFVLLRKFALSKLKLD